MLQCDLAGPYLPAKCRDIVVGVSGDEIVTFARSKLFATADLVGGRGNFRVVADAGVYRSSEHGA